MKCECGEDYRQVDYHGKLPHFCHNCGRRIANVEDYLTIDIDHGSHGDPKFLFIRGKINFREVVGFRYDMKTHDICKFTEHNADMKGLKYLLKFIEKFADGKIDFFGCVNGGR